MANDYSLNIRRYADNTPPPENNDVRAHLRGGVPKVEVEAYTELFGAHGFDPKQLLVEQDTGYFGFVPDLRDRADIKRCIDANNGVRARESEMRLPRFGGESIPGVSALVSPPPDGLCSSLPRPHASAVGYPGGIRMPSQCRAIDPDGF